MDLISSLPACEWQKKAPKHNHKIVMFVAADFVLGIVCALLTDFETLCVGFAAPIVSGHQQLISSLWVQSLMRGHNLVEPA